MWMRSSCAVFLLLTTASTGVSAGRQRPAYNSSASTPTSPAPAEIHVDQDCHILQAPAPIPAGNGKPKWHRDSAICRLESASHSAHPEETIDGEVMQRSWVSISEQEYLLGDVTQEPVAFVVEQYVPENWRVDSDPQPVETVPVTDKKGGQVALFRVYAQPGEIVRLHVGIRHSQMRKPKPIKPAA